MQRIARRVREAFAEAPAQLRERNDMLALRRAQEVDGDERAGRAPSGDEHVCAHPLKVCIVRAAPSRCALAAGKVRIALLGAARRASEQALPLCRART